MLFLRKNQSFFENAFKNTYGYNAFAMAGVRKTFDMAVQVIRQRKSADSITEKEVFQLRLYLYWAMVITREWGTSGLEEEPEDLSEKLIASVPSDIKDMLIH